MLYLALVQRLPLKAPQLQLLAVERKYKLWQRLDNLETITIGQEATKLANNKLALVKLTATREVIEVIDGAIALPQILHNLSLQLYKLLEQTKEIKEWRESLEYQSIELNKRAATLDAAEELLKLERELFIQNLLTDLS